MFLQNHKKLIALGIIFILALVAIPLTVMQSQKQQDVRQRAAEGDAVTLAISPSQLPRTIGTFTANLDINANGNNITAAEIALQSDSDGVVFRDFSVTASGFREVYQQIDPSGKRMQIVVANPDNAPFQGPTLGIITFQATGNGNASINYISSDNGYETRIVSIKSDKSSFQPPLANTSQTIAQYSAPNEFNIEGTVFVDSNENARQDEGEQPVRTRTKLQLVTLNSQGQPSGTPIEDETNSEGVYHNGFRNLPRDAYRITLIIPEGYRRAQGTDNSFAFTLDSNKRFNFGIVPIPTATLIPSPTSIPTFTISGRVLDDTLSRTRLYQGATITLAVTDENGTPLSSQPTGYPKTATSDNGTYTITDVTANYYRISITMPQGFRRFNSDDSKPLGRLERTPDNIDFIIARFCERRQAGYREECRYTSENNNDVYFWASKVARQSESDYINADFDGNGKVDIKDFNVWRSKKYR